jgi:hypothetical protein
VCITPFAELCPAGFNAITSEAPVPDRFKLIVSGQVVKLSGRITSTEIFCPVLKASLWLAISHLSEACAIRGKFEIRVNNKKVSAFVLIYDFLLSNLKNYKLPGDFCLWSADQQLNIMARLLILRFMGFNLDSYQ